jgi:uracil-DNA glycosylase
MSKNLLQRLGDWDKVLGPLISDPRFDETREYIVKQNSSNTVYPDPDNVFRAFELCSLKDLRVVILGQDPYHNGQATGLCFGVNGGKIPPSLRIIYKELCSQFDHTPDDFDYSLEHWSKQGVLMLNTALTVNAKQPGSHSDAWKWWTKEVIKGICIHNRHTIFVLWGKHAQSYKDIIPIAVLHSAHPAAEAYSGGTAGFYGNGHFLNINDRITPKINWFELPKKLTEQEQIDLYNE